MTENMLNNNINSQQNNTNYEKKYVINSQKIIQIMKTNASILLYSNTVAIHKHLITLI